MPSTRTPGDSSSAIVRVRCMTAALVPHDIVWFYERGEPPAQHPRFTHLERFTDLPAWIDAIA